MSTTPRPLGRSHHRVDLETAAGLGCLKCMNEYETGEKSNKNHDDDCPRKRPYFNAAAAAAQSHCQNAPDSVSEKKRKHQATEDEEEDNITKNNNDDPSAPRRVGNSIDFPLSNLRSHLVCSLCNGYFRDPQTVADCLHTFCRSCLILFFRQGTRCCPTCNSRLGPDPFHNEISTDRTLQEIIDKVFPHMKAKEDEEERFFYEQRGIELKPEYQGAKVHHDQGQGRVKTSTGVMLTDDLLLDLILKPDGQPPNLQQRLPPLHNSLLRTSGRLKIASLKKYLVQRLGIKNSITNEIEILCNGDPMGDELSLTFITRTRWFYTDEVLTLKYRLEEESTK